MKTELSPVELLKEIHEIENILGRKRKESWGQRTIDIDILFYENEIIKTDFLTLPHPYLQERNFVLIPLYEIAPNFIHPVLAKSIEELCKLCADQKNVREVH